MVDIGFVLDTAHVLHAILRNFRFPNFTVDILNRCLPFQLASIDPTTSGIGLVEIVADAEAPTHSLRRRQLFCFCVLLPIQATWALRITSSVSAVSDNAGRAAISTQATAAASSWA